MASAITMQGLWIVAGACVIAAMAHSLIRAACGSEKPFTPLGTAVDVLIFCGLVHMWTYMGWVK